MSGHTPMHTFHIPVMGTGFTIDTPIKVARYGISSSISLVDDVLIEQVRKFYCEQENEPYEEITRKSEDSRARRITSYLNLVDLLVQRQVEESGWPHSTLDRDAADFALEDQATGLEEPVGDLHASALD